ncbi:hypothetical protein LWF15_28935 [Kineosporia rhizophila]|uniref:hypothetical protein n=1 Tax=Kineosporia TaxID=49184 RepID=UPI001E5FF942|nr:MULTISPECIES: hypothetical protein [Kineosporia]MCE0539532.1 hypothetical protein [Kineosporia rhizophila]
MAAVLLLGLALVPVSFSAFTGQSGSGPNTFKAATVALGDDDSGTALFTVSGLRPGDSGSRCIALTYTGTVPAQVRMYVAPGDVSGTGLERYLTLTVTEGTDSSGGSFASCSGFTPAAAGYSARLNTLAGTASDWGSGIGSFAPTGSGQVRVYRIGYQLTAGAAAQGLSTRFRLTWEARNS